jgi:iron(III) transport system substrate-binding protein
MRPTPLLSWPRCPWRRLPRRPGAAQDKVLNLYSARHYQTDEALYQNFTRATGIRINRVDADDAGVLARLKSEGASSPADVILLVDAARLVARRGRRPVPTRTQRCPGAAHSGHLRSKDSGEGSAWFGFSTRARVVVYDKVRVPATDVDQYEKLAPR